MTARLAGKRILVVEDEYFLATDLKRTLASAGALVVGPVAQLERGLALLAAEPVDAAVLDVNLDGQPSYPIAERLAASGTPCLFVTGYDGWSMPAAFSDAPRLGKPVVPGALLDMVAGLFDASRKP